MNKDKTLCLLGVENTQTVHKNKAMKADFNKNTRFFQLRKILVFTSVEALDKMLSKYEVSKSLSGNQLTDLCEPPFYNG